MNIYASQRKFEKAEISKFWKILQYWQQVNFSSWSTTLCHVEYIILDLSKARTIMVDASNIWTFHSTCKNIGFVAYLINFELKNKKNCSQQWNIYFRWRCWILEFEGIFALQQPQPLNIVESWLHKQHRTRQSQKQYFIIHFNFWVEEELGGRRTVATISTGKPLFICHVHWSNNVEPIGSTFGMDYTKNFLINLTTLVKGVQSETSLLFVTVPSITMSSHQTGVE